MTSSFLGALAFADINHVFQHPAQQQNVNVVATLIEELRACHSFSDYDDFQRSLFQVLYECEEHKSLCRRCASRLRRGKSLPVPLPLLPDGTNPNNPETWRIEDLVFDRICRQLRAVGDALAWRVSGHDRRYIIALSSNSSPGLMVGKAGLNAELEVAARLRDQGRFALLHGLTNCLRIGDLTEFLPDGSKRLDEVKTSRKAKAGPQLKRMKAAVEAVMSGGELPGRIGNRIVTPEVRCTTHVRTLVATINQAETRGIAGTAISNSRALTAYSFPAMAQTRVGEAPEQLANDWEEERQRAIVEAGIASTTHHLRLASVTRNHDFVPSVTPFALYPLSPRRAALLMCDYVGFDVTVAPERIASGLAKRGIAAQIPLPRANGKLKATDTVLVVSKGARGMQLHPGALYELLMECLDLATWTSAIAEVLDDPDAPAHPVPAFVTTRVWR